MPIFNMIESVYRGGLGLAPVLRNLEPRVHGNNCACVNLAKRWPLINFQNGTSTEIPVVQPK